MTRAPKRLEAPASRNGSSPQNDATDAPTTPAPKRLEAPASRNGSSPQNDATDATMTPAPKRLATTDARDPSDQADPVPQRQGAQAGRRADLRRRLPAPQVQDRRRLARRQLRGRAGQRRRPRPDAQRGLHRRGHRLLGVRRRWAGHEPLAGGGHLSRPRPPAGLGPTGAGRRRRRGRRHAAARPRQPHRPPPGPAEVHRRDARPRVRPRGGRPAGRVRAGAAGRTAAVDRRRASRHPRRRDRPAGPVGKGRRPRRGGAAHGAARAHRRGHS